MELELSLPRDRRLEGWLRSHPLNRPSWRTAWSRSWPLAAAGAMLGLGAGCWWATVVLVLMAVGVLSLAFRRRPAGRVETVPGRHRVGLTPHPVRTHRPERVRHFRR